MAIQNTEGSLGLDQHFPLNVLFLLVKHGKSTSKSLYMVIYKNITSLAEQCQDQFKLGLAHRFFCIYILVDSK